jgi:energy-converting hydrogenase Eha subunit G
MWLWALMFVGMGIPIGIAISLMLVDYRDEYEF